MRLHKPSYALVYAAIIPVIQEIGRDHGYAIAVHGSMATDLDLLACPWTIEATDAETLVNAIHTHFQCMCFVRMEGQPEAKPHGRLAWSMHFNPEHDLPHGGPYLDISVMPRILNEGEA